MPRSISVAARIAELVEARSNCQASGNAEWLERHTSTLHEIVRDHMPSGSGVDHGCQVDLNASKRNKLVIIVPFHCMNQDGYYVGWRTYRITVRPAFQSIDVAVSGRDYNGIKDYLGELFHEILTRIIPIVACLSDKP